MSGPDAAAGYELNSILFVPLAKRDNPAAVRRVADLAGHHAAELTVLGVVPEPSLWHRLLDQPLLDQAVREAEQEALAERLERCSDQLAHHRTNRLVRAGATPLVIIEEVVAGGHDLVVVTSDEDHEDRASIKRLLRACPCPVWVIRPTRAKVQRVLAAVDPNPDERGLNRRILELAATMSAVHGGELHAVHAWELYGEATMRSSAFVHTTPEEIGRLLDEERTRHRHAFDDLLRSVQTPDQVGWTAHLTKGRAGHVVVDLVEKKRINLLVLGTVARKGLPGLLIGNTAEQLLDEVRCSVIAVKPPGFSAPVG